MARYVDADTLAVVRIDATKLDADAGPAERDGIVRSARDALRQFAQELAPATAAGATRAYLLVTPATLARRRWPVVVIPTAGAEQAAAVASSPAVARIGRAYSLVAVVGPEDAVLLGTAAATDAAAAVRPVARPELAGAFGEEGAAVTAAFVPSPLVRLFAVQAARGQMGPGSNIPAALPEVMRGLSRATMALSLPPGPSAAVRLEFVDAATAGEAAKLLKDGLAWGEGKLAGEVGPERAAAITAAMSPATDGSAVAVDVTPQEADALAPFLGKTLLKARYASQRYGSMSNLRQLGQLIRQHAIDKGDKDERPYPRDLAKLRRYAAGQQDASDAPFDELTTNPRAGSADGYVYLGGGKTDAAPVATVLMYEKLPPAGTLARTEFDENGVSALYGDGSVRMMPLAELRQLAEAQGFEVEQSAE